MKAKYELENAAFPTVSTETITKERTFWIATVTENRRQYCTHHEFVHGGLVSAKGVAYPQINRDKPYGAFAFCLHCKLIECIHVWNKNEERIYSIERSDQVSEFLIDTY